MILLKNALKGSEDCRLTTARAATRGMKGGTTENVKKAIRHSGLRSIVEVENIDNPISSVHPENAVELLTSRIYYSPILYYYECKERNGN